MAEKKAMEEPEITTYDREELDIKAALTGPGPGSSDQDRSSGV